MRLQHHTLLITTILALAAPRASACFSGLVLIPTTDIVSAGDYSIEYQADGTQPHRNIDTRLVNTEIGISDRAEIGLDYDCSSGADPRSILNAKLILGADERNALAAGFYNVGKHLQSSPYLVGSYASAGGRLHLGAVGVEHKARFMVGADRPLTDRITLMADATTGSENASSIGASYTISRSMSIVAGACFPNNGDDATFTFHFCLCGPLTRRG